MSNSNESGQRSLAEDDSDGHVAVSETEQTPGFVKEKIRASNPKKRGVGSRARVRGQNLKLKPTSGVIKNLIDAIGQEDVNMVLKVWRDAMTATTQRWDRDLEKWVTVPDHRTRLEATKIVAAYKEGLPVQRQITATGKIEDFQAMLDRAAHSPVAQEKFGSSLLAAEDKQIPPALPETP